MPLRLTSELRLPADDRSCLLRMIARAEAGVPLTVRLRIDPLSPPVFDDVLERGDMSRVLMFAELDEEADDVLLIIRECGPDGAPRKLGRRGIGPIMYPDALSLAINKETGGLLISSLPDARVRLVH